MLLQRLGCVTSCPLLNLSCRLHEQLGLRALAKRLLLLHGSKAVALAAFAAAMQQAGAAGLLLLAGVVLLAPALGAPRAGATRRQPLLHAGLTAAAAMAILWILAQTALCVPYIQVWLHIAVCSFSIPVAIPHSLCTPHIAIFLPHMTYQRVLFFPTIAGPAAPPVSRCPRLCSLVGLPPAAAPRARRPH